MPPRIGLTTCPTVLDGRVVESLERAYVAAVVRAGAVPYVLPVLDPAAAGDALAGLDGLLLTGGGDVDPAWYGCAPSPHLGAVDAAHDAWEIALVRAGLAAQLPMLGICRGAQVMNVALGGTLMQHLPDISPLAHCVKDQSGSLVHGVRVDEASRLRSVLGAGALGVNSLHHQAVAEVGTGLAAVAWADDGVVEAVEGTGASRLLGVQWHPELLPDGAAHRALFDWLCDEAAQVRPAAVLASAAA